MDLCVKEGKRKRTKFFFCEKRLSRNFIHSICLLEPFQRPVVNRWAAWTFSFNLSPVLHKTILLLLRGQSQSNYLTYLEKTWLFYHPLPSSLYTLNYPVQKGLLLAPFYRFVEKARRQLCIIQPNADWDISSLIWILCTWSMISFSTNRQRILELVAWLNS